MSASNPNLNDIFTDVANAIRTKDGSSAEIHPVNFADKISAIPTGDNPLADAWKSFKAGNSTNWSYAFGRSTGAYICANIKSLDSLDFSGSERVTTMISTFDSCSSLISIPLFNTSKVTMMNTTFKKCSSLKSIPAFDVSSVTNFSFAFDSCYALEEIHMTGMKVNFNISSSTKLTKEALVEVLNNLATVSSTQTLTMGSTNLKKLTAEEKAIATNKGWTLA